MFSLTSEQQQLAANIRAFLQTELSPMVEDLEARAEFPVDLLPRLAKLDLLGLSFESPYGSGGGHVEVALLTEELAAIAGGVCSGVMTHMIGAKLIELFGTLQQKERYLKPLLSGEQMCAIAITEPDHGSDVASIQTRATRTRGGWLLRGSKIYITNASHAGIFMVMGKSNQVGGKEGLSMLLLESPAQGLHIGAPLKKLGWHTSDTAPVHLEDCFVPHENLLGQEGHGFSQLMQGFVFERIIMAAMGIGAARSAFEDAREYAKQRRQFGRPIAEFQAVRHKLADMATGLQAARQLTYWAATLADEKPADGGPAAMAKVFSSEMAERVAADAVQVLGGIGFMAETRTSRIYRDVKVLTIGGGTSEIMRGVVARWIGL